MPSTIKDLATKIKHTRRLLSYRDVGTIMHFPKGEPCQFAHGLFLGRTQDSKRSASWLLINDLPKNQLIEVTKSYWVGEVLVVMEAEVQTIESAKKAGLNFDSRRIIDSLLAISKSAQETVSANEQAIGAAKQLNF